MATFFASGKISGRPPADGAPPNIALVVYVAHGPKRERERAEKGGTFSNTDGPTAMLSNTNSKKYGRGKRRDIRR